MISIKYLEETSQSSVNFGKLQENPVAGNHVLVAIGSAQCQAFQQFQEFS